MGVISNETRFDKLIHELRMLNVPIKVEADWDWAFWTKTYNLRIPVTPAVVVCPNNILHICIAVRLARRCGMKVQARSGGHSYASHSNGGVNGAMVIDLGRFNATRCHSTKASVAAGVRLGNMAQDIYKLSGSALPHGTCAGVGVGGHFTHGGFGFFSRAWGLAMDRITGLGVITADGNDIFVSETEYPDLYYAMRGAADSFGIVHLFELSPVPAPRSVVHWKVNVPGVAGNIEASVKAFQHIQDFVHNEILVDRQLGLNLSLSSNHFAIDGTYLGSADTLQEILQVLLRGLEAAATDKKDPKVESEIEELTWLDSLKELNQGEELESAYLGYDKHDNFFAKSVVVPEPGLNEKALTSFFTYLVQVGCLLEVGLGEKIGSFVLIDLWGGADSQINAKDVGFSAFAHRDACWVAQLYGYVGADQKMPARGIEYINGLADSMAKHLPRSGAYLNYTDPSLTREQAHEQYYGKELSAKLKQLKQKWDPDNVFSNPQSI